MGSPLNIWTRAYRPFAITGVNANIRTEYAGERVEHVLNPEPMYDYPVLVYAVNSPRTGKTWYVDSVSGGLLGDSLEMVENDISTHYMTGGTDSALAFQRANAAEQCQKAVPYDSDVFWEMLEGKGERRGTA
jgi:hypothetical protein